MEFLALRTSGGETKLKTIGPKFTNTFRAKFMEFIRGWPEDSEQQRLFLEECGDPVRQQNSLNSLNRIILAIDGQGSVSERSDDVQFGFRFSVLLRAGGFQFTVTN
jgi:hypothetical protein